MINHVRTLLLNVKSEIDPNIVGEEYISPSFSPIVFDTQINKIYNVLFGGSPDRYMLNYRGQQIMSMLHSTELEQNVLDYDSRITYWPSAGATFYDFPFVTTAEKIGNFTGDIHFIDELKPSDATGQLYHMWRIYVKDSATVVVTHLNDPKEEQEYSYAITGGRSNTIPLLGSTQYFSFNAPVGSSWTVKGFAKPARDMGDIFSTLKQSVTIVDELALWGAAPAEPLLTYKNLWRDHDEYAYSLGGLVMALVAKISDLHTKAV